MERLPTEVVVEITSYLSLVDKLNLACCKSNLWNIIKENSLYSKLVFQDATKFDQAMAYVQRFNLHLLYAISVLVI